MERSLDKTKCSPAAPVRFVSTLWAMPLLYFLLAMRVQITLTKKPIMIMVAQKRNFRVKEMALDSQVALVTKIFSAVSICCWFMV